MDQSTDADIIHSCFCIFNNIIEIDPAAHITVFDYAGLKEYITSLFDGPVDVVSRDGLKPYVRPAASADAVYAF